MYSSVSGVGLIRRVCELIHKIQTNLNLFFIQTNTEGGVAKDAFRGK